MEAKNVRSPPWWSITFQCTNPWCFAELQASEQDLKYGPYPGVLDLNGSGYWVTCSKCGWLYAVHKSMLYEPMIERLSVKFGCGEAK